MSEDDERRARRAQWPIAAIALEDEGRFSESASTLESRLASMWPLAVEAYTLAGRPIPRYARREAPSRLYRVGEGRPDES